MRYLGEDGSGFELLAWNGRSMLYRTVSAHDDPTVTSNWSPWARLVLSLAGPLPDDVSQALDTDHHQRIIAGLSPEPTDTRYLELQERMSEVFAERIDPNPAAGLMRQIEETVG